MAGGGDVVLVYFFILGVSIGFVVMCQGHETDGLHH